MTHIGKKIVDLTLMFRFYKLPKVLEGRKKGTTRSVRWNICPIKISHQLKLAIPELMH